MKGCGIKNDATSIYLSFMLNVKQHNNANIANFMYFEQSLTQHTSRKRTHCGISIDVFHREERQIIVLFGQNNFIQRHSFIRIQSLCVILVILALMDFDKCGVKPGVLKGNFFWVSKDRKYDTVGKWRVFYTY